MVTGIDVVAEIARGEREIPAPLYAKGDTLTFSNRKDIRGKVKAMRFEIVSRGLACWFYRMAGHINIRGWIGEDALTKGA